MSFLFPSLLWIGLPLLALPVLLHLLNLRRQRVVRWAAIEYLLESEQRAKTWVNLRQWLLLAARLLAILLAVL
ncbi:MAG: BatA domain-containing protein, partial [Planctomycetota bacterium]